MRAIPLLAAAFTGLCVWSAATFAAGDEPPARRAGAWEMKMNMQGPQGRGTNMRMCVDPAQEKRGSMFSSPMRGAGHAETCASKEFHHVANGFAFHAVCTAGGVTTTTDGTATGDFQTHYHIDVNAHQSGGPGPGVSHVEIEGRWLGPCSAGEQPGDMSIVLPDGRVIKMGPGMGQAMAHGPG